MPGHEVVADTDDDRRVVLEPVLGCVARGIDPPCAACARGDLGGCERLAFGHLEPGLQTGFCCDTGGGWSTYMVAHPSQLHAVPDDMSDEAAVMVEPTACAVHAALRHPIRRGRHRRRPRRRHARAADDRRAPPPDAGRRDHHRRPATPTRCGWRAELGADQVCEPGALPRLVRRLTASLAYRRPAHRRLRRRARLRRRLGLARRRRWPSSGRGARSSSSACRPR